MSFCDNLAKLRRFENLAGSFVQCANDWVRRYHAENTDSWNLTISAVHEIGRTRRSQGTYQYGRDAPDTRQTADMLSSAGTRSATESITKFAPAFNSDFRAASSRLARSDAVNPRKAASDSPTAFPDAATPTVNAPAAFPSATPASALSNLTNG